MAASLFGQSNEIPNSIYDIKLQALDSDTEIDLSEFKGKKILFVNVASKCGFTGQYAALQKLYADHKDQLVIIGLPCNQFLFQESGSESKIATFCSTKYGVEFPMTGKIKVKGKDQHPLYTWLTKKDYNKVGDYSVSWNFNKFMVDEEGQLLEHFPSKVKPDAEAIMKYLN